MRNLECRVMRGPELLRPDNLAHAGTIASNAARSRYRIAWPICIAGRCRPPDASLIHGVLRSYPAERMNGGPCATRHHLHEISKVRLRILARPYEINETSLARLELDL